MVGSLEEIAASNKWISKRDLKKIASKYNNKYGEYLKSL